MGNLTNKVKRFAKAAGIGIVSKDLTGDSVMAVPDGPVERIKDTASNKGTLICNWAAGALSMVSANAGEGVALDSAASIDGYVAIKCSFSNAASATYIAKFIPNEPFWIGNFKTLQIPLMFSSNNAAAAIGQSANKFQIWLQTASAKQLRLQLDIDLHRPNAWFCASINKDASSSVIAFGGGATSLADFNGETITEIRVVQVTNANSPTTTVWIGPLRQGVRGRGRISIVMDGQYISQYLYLDRPACASSFGGSGGLEGPSSLTGTPKPRLYGDALLIPAVLVDAAKQIYMVHENPVSVPGQLTAWDGGAAYTMDTPYASLSALQSTAPAPGHACAFESGPTYVRLGTNPTYGLYCNSNGLAMNGGSATIGNIRDEVGLSSAPVSGGGFAIAGYAAGNETLLALAANFGRAALSVPSVNRQGEFCGVLLSVPTSGAAVAAFGRGDCIDMRREAPSGIPEPAGVVRLRGGRNYLGDRPLNPSADLVTRPWLAQAWYASATITHNELLAKYPKAATIDVSIDGMVGAVSGIAAQYESLFCTPRHQYRLTLPLTLAHLMRDIGQVVVLQLPRFGLSAGRPMLIVGIELALRDRHMQLTVWG